MTGRRGSKKKAKKKVARKSRAKTNGQASTASGHTSNIKPFPEREAMPPAPVEGNAPSTVPGGEWDRLKRIRDEMKSIKQEKHELQKKIAFLTTDLYRAEDDLRRVMDEMSAKYDLKKGVREFDMETGRIVAVR